MHDSDGIPDLLVYGFPPVLDEQSVISGSSIFTAPCDGLYYFSFGGTNIPGMGDSIDDGVFIRLEDVVSGTVLAQACCDRTRS